MADYESTRGFDTYFFLCLCTNWDFFASSSANDFAAKSIKSSKIKPSAKEQGLERERESTSEAKSVFGDDSAGGGEAGEERPVPVPLALEEHGPRIKLPHFLGVLLSSSLIKFISSKLK